MEPDAHCNPQWKRLLQKAKLEECNIGINEIFSIVNAIAPPLVKGLAPPSKPIALVMCGPAGAGKTTIKSQIFGELGITPEQTILAEPDAILAALEQWKNPVTKAKCQKTSGQLLYKFLLERLAKTKHHIVYDTICRGIGNTMDAINLFARNGYYVILSEVYVPLDVIQRRVRKRYNNAAETNKRFIEPAEVQRMYEEFSGKASVYFGRTFKGEPVRINELRLYNNEGDEPLLLYKRVGDKVEMGSNMRPFYFNYRGAGAGASTGKIKGRKTRRKRHL